MGDQLAYLQKLPSIALVIVVCLLALVMTEIASNTATCTILLPVIKRMVSHSFRKTNFNHFYNYREKAQNFFLIFNLKAYSLHISPLSVMLPVTLSC